VKKLGVLFIGANLLFSPQVNAFSFVSKRRSFDCQSDKKISAIVKKNKVTVPEYSALVNDLNDDVHVSFLVKKNYLLKEQLRTQVLVDERSALETSNTYLTVQSDNWALAIAPEKKRASLYNMNPDLNEVPMFCLSPQ
jgi:hypothetical protein